MGIANRDKDNSEKNYVIQNTFGAVATGASTWVGVVPTAGQILGIQLSGRGLSAVPVYQLAVARWTSAGITGFVIGSAVTLAGAFGLSGSLVGTSFVSSSYAAQSGDLLVLNSSGANTAVTDLAVAVVIQATQDIKQTCGL